MPTINYICAICGAGKTTAAIEYVSAAIKNDQRFILFQPTTELNQSTFERFDPTLRQNGTVRVINSQSVPQGQTVTGVLNDVLKSLLQNWGLGDRDPVPAGRLSVDGPRSA